MPRARAWGKGYGTEAGRLLLDYAFERLGFHRISIGVVGFNERALRFWEGLGFKKEGVHRDGYYCDNEYSDFIMMSILEDEYKTLHKEKRARTMRLAESGDGIEPLRDPRVQENDSTEEWKYQAR